MVKPGTHIKVKADFDWKGRRPHLELHGRHGDIGTVVERPKQSPKMSDLYIIVDFQNCQHQHRLLEEEIEIVKNSKRRKN
ncbi:MAG TPA: hypothetical protein VLE47_04090 [Candidatus Saccharimonadales bacterium]|nr:hypothetical protein [Candidatus Saccharimonadales bacterium]